MSEDAPLPSSFDGDADFYNENRWQKFARRLKEEPLVFFGVGLTCWALLSASRSIRRGNDPNYTNRMFRYRLYAQAFTLAAMIGGSYYYNADRFKRSEYKKLKKVQEGQEKRDAWIRELEARDLDDQEWRAKMGKVRDLQREEAEIKAIEEKKARQEEEENRNRNVNDDGRGVIAAIRDQHNKSREKEGRRQGVEKETVKKKTAISSATAPPTRETDGKKYQSILGETEAGGLLGINHLKNLWNSGKPADGASTAKNPEEK